MAPYLTTAVSFADVPITDDGVDTATFLKASDGLVGMFDLLGSAAFTPVKNDLSGNITKIRKRYDDKPELSATLELLVQNEKTEKKRTATEGLMWLLRGHKFTCSALQFSQADKSVELATGFTNAYEGSLKKYHSIFVRPIFTLAMKACPYRADFYKKLAEDPDGGPTVSDEKVNEDLDRWLEALDGIIKRMDKFYEDGGHGKGF